MQSAHAPLLATLLALSGCLGELGGDADEATARSAASAGCAALARVTEADRIAIENAAYFEASYLPAYRASECAKVTGTIIGRAAHGGFGQGYRGVISAPYQFEVYDAIRICGGGSCYRLTGGLSLEDATSITRWGKSESASAHLAGFRVCRDAVQATLRATPASTYLYFAAAGNGQNSFKGAAAFPAGCNLLDEPAPEPPPEPATPPVDGSGHASRLHGTVLAGGAAVAGVQVSAWGHSAGDFRSAVTDENGIYVIEGLDPQSLYNLVVNAVYKEGAFETIDSAHGSAVRDNVELVAGPDAWHGEDFSLEF